jgi:thioredoxin 1
MKSITFAGIILFLFASIYATGTEPAANDGKAVINMTKSDFLNKVMDYEKNPTTWVFKGDKPCLIDFYADWCGPCRITSPILEELAQEYKGKIYVYKVNVDNEKELSQVFGISGIPAFLYCPMEGKPTMTSGIARDKEQTKEMFRNYIDTILLKK